MLKLFKNVIIAFIIMSISINSFAAVVSDNDGSAFITKTEFDSLKNDFQTQIDQYNTSIDSKIDAAISAYLAGVKVQKKSTMQSILNVINAYGYNYSNMSGYPFSNGNVELSCTAQTPEVNVVGIFCYQNLDCGPGGKHHCGGARTSDTPKNGAGTAWEITTLNSYRCLTKFMNVYEVLNFTISNAPARHDRNNYGLAHTYQSNVRNTATNLTTEIVSRSQDGFLQRNSSGNYSSTTLASGGAYLTLTKSIKNTDNNVNKAYFSPIGNISATTYGYGYAAGTVLGSILTNTNPIGGGTATDNTRVKFTTSLYYAHSDTSNCPFSSSTVAPVTQYAYEDLYWNKHYVNTERFNLTQLYVYPATLAYGEGVRYYNGLPVCTSKSGKGTLKFKLKPATTSSNGATRVDLCFRSEGFTNNLPTSDSSKNIKNIKFKKASDSTWSVSTSLGVCENLAPGTEYDFEIENFPSRATLWVKPNRVQRNSESTQVYAYLQTIGDITIEEE